MKKINKFCLLLIAVICIFSVLPAAYADNNTTADEITQKRYESMCAFAEEHFEDLTLPEYEDMIIAENDKLMFVQTKHGRAKAQEMLDAPDGEVCAAVNDLSQVKVYAQKDGYSFVIIMEDVDGTMGWVETQYLTDNWSYSLCHGRTLNSY